ncbi:hypothetical protein M8J76_011318 [Diaphorina citri]|nr:hypothetical protein M8J76_011318 [Diaphorina citri]KAI5739904.1 hypothetical protein M8J77_024826 [Diaphorina citri]
MKTTYQSMKPATSYLGKVINALGIQAARNKFKVKRGLVGISQLASGLKALRSKAEANQFKESVNYLLDKGLVKLVLPEVVKRSFQEVGLGGKQLCCCNPCCDPCCRPRLSVGVVYGDDGLPVNQLCGPCGCGPCGNGCGDCCGNCRPRLSIGVVYPNEVTQLNQGLNQYQAGLNQLCGCGSCCSTCRPRLSVGVVYPSEPLA